MEKCLLSVVNSRISFGPADGGGGEGEKKDERRRTWDMVDIRCECESEFLDKVGYIINMFKSKKVWEQERVRVRISVTVRIKCKEGINVYNQELTCKEGINVKSPRMNPGAVELYQSR